MRGAALMRVHARVGGVLKSRPSLARGETFIVTGAQEGETTDIRSLRTPHGPRADAAHISPAARLIMFRSEWQTDWVTTPLMLLATLSCPVTRAQPSEPLVQIGTIALPSVASRIDHLAFDAQHQRLFVAALGNDTVEVLDVDAVGDTDDLFFDAR